MRDSLRPILARVERLAVRVNPALRDIDYGHMSDGELEREIVQFAEQAAGPATAFATAEAFVDAFLRESGQERDRDSAVAKMVRDHWERVRWFREHGDHGPVVFAKNLPGIMATCPCGAKLWSG
jgi:hypothetical protein